MVCVIVGQLRQLMDAHGHGEFLEILDDELVELATREMEILGLLDPRDVIGGAVVRQEKAYPVYDEDYAANVAAMRHELEDK